MNQRVEFGAVPGAALTRTIDFPLRARFTQLSDSSFRLDCIDANLFIAIEHARTP